MTTFLSRRLFIRSLDAIPVFFAANPVTGSPVSLPPGKKSIGTERLVAAPSARTGSAPAGNLEARVKEAERRLAVSKAWDRAENMSSVYGDYLDDLDFGGLAKLFAAKGNKEIPFSGFYVGRESIARRDATAAPPGSRPRTTLPLHWRTQNVIFVAEDGRSASIRSRLFQPQSSRTRAMGFSGGMYHDQVVLENGVWKLWSVAIDEHYFSSPTYEGGWSAARAPQPAAPRAGGPPAGQRAGGAAPAGQPGAGGRGAAPANNYPPDIPLTRLGERERGFRGGTGEAIAWPGILPMWFHYKNPVSGRVPPLYGPDCVPCVHFPETSMKNHAYLLPPS